MLKNKFAGVAAFAASLLFIGCGTDVPLIDYSADASNGQAANTVTPGPKPDGTPCSSNLECMGGNVCADETSSCIAGVCASRAPGDKLSHAGYPCDDGSMCTTGDICTAGKCSGKVVDCDDKTTCTNDSCDAKLGCQHSVQSGVLCSDGDACTSGDKCSAGGTCAGDKIDCDDKNLCTTDSCDPVKGCVSIPNANPCDDGNVCTEGDLCAAGACGAGSLKNCDDGKPCIDDACDPLKGCTYSPSKAGQMCNDSNAKTVGDVCDGSGQCIGKTATACAVDADCLGLEVNKCAAYVCDAGLGLCKPQPAALMDDNNLCTLEQCDPKTGNTLHVPLSISCNDGNACTVGDKCIAGSCMPGQAVLACDDGNACTVDSCDAAQGCAYMSAVCDDKSIYTDDSCAPKYGCQFVTKNFLVTCVVPDDVPDSALSTCNAKSMFGMVAGTKVTISDTKEAENTLSISVKLVCATLKGGAWWLLNSNVYGPDGVPLGSGGGGGANISVMGPDGKLIVNGKSGQLSKISSGDAPDLVVLAAALQAYCE